MEKQNIKKGMISWDHLKMLILNMPKFEDLDIVYQENYGELVVIEDKEI